MSRSESNDSVAGQPSGPLWTGCDRAVPLCLQSRSLVGKSFSESLHHRSYELRLQYFYPEFPTLESFTSLGPSACLADLPIPRHFDRRKLLRYSVRSAITPPLSVPPSLVPAPVPQTGS